MTKIQPKTAKKAAATRETLTQQGAEQREIRSSRHLGSVWDRLEKAQPAHFTKQVPAGAGFTHREYRDRYKIQDGAARQRIRALITANKVRLLGYRGKEIVYDVV